MKQNKNGALIGLVIAALAFVLVQESAVAAPQADATNIAGYTVTITGNITSHETARSIALMVVESDTSKLARACSAITIGCNAWIKPGHMSSFNGYTYTVPTILTYDYDLSVYTTPADNHSVGPNPLVTFIAKKVSGVIGDAVTMIWDDSHITVVRNDNARTVSVTVHD
jgi:hypothetical protein